MFRLPIPIAATWLVAAAAAQQTAPDPMLAQVAAAYVAKVTASAMFVSGRTLDSVLAEELAPDRPLEALIRPLLSFDVDHDARAVTVKLGKVKATAVATKNLGCTLVRDDTTAATLRERAAPSEPFAAPRNDALWPRGERMATDPIDGVDRPALDRALDAAMREPSNGKRVHTRAVVVVRDGTLVAERYAEGYHADMPLPGWSMTKSLVCALVGIRVRQGKLALDAPLPVPEWRTTPNDARAAIRMTHLLAMTAGQRWSEDYDDPKSDALRMLFASSDHANVFAAAPPDTAPGHTFCYASGSTNLICRVLRTTFASDAEYFAFPRTALFAPLGMRSAVLETDPSGTFVGSSYGFATARDWARLGLLFAQDGVFDGERLLPAGFVARSRAPEPTSHGRFGAHLWLDVDPDGDGPEPREWPDLPEDLFYMSGHEGQYCVILPSQRLVVVRLGCTKNGGFSLHALLRDVLAACTK